MTIDRDRQVSADMLVANSQHKVRGQHTKGEPSKPCIFCKGTLFNDYSDKYFTVISKKNQFRVDVLYVSRLAIYVKSVLVLK